MSAISARTVVYMNNVANTRSVRPNSRRAELRAQCTSTTRFRVLQCIPMAPREMGLSLQYNWCDGGGGSYDAASLATLEEGKLF